MYICIYLSILYTILCNIHIWYDIYIIYMYIAVCACKLRVCIYYTYMKVSVCICATWLTHMCDLIHSCVWHDAFTCVTWLKPSALEWPDSCIPQTWLIYKLDMTHFDICSMCEKTHSHVWHYALTRATWCTHIAQLDSFMFVTWLIHMRDMTQNVCPWVARLIRTSDLTHLYVRHDSFWHVLHVRQDSFTCVTLRVQMHDVTHSYVQQDSFICVTWPIHVWDSFICVISI